MSAIFNNIQLEYFKCLLVYNLSFLEIFVIFHKCTVMCYTEAKLTGPSSQTVWDTLV